MFKVCAELAILDDTGHRSLHNSFEHCSKNSPDTPKKAYQLTQLLQLCVITKHAV